MTGWGARWKTERSQRLWVHMNFLPKFMWVGVINFTFILVDEMTLLWIFSGCDVKTHLVKAGPSGPINAFPHWGWTHPTILATSGLGQKYCDKQKLNSIYIAVTVWGLRTVSHIGWKPLRQSRAVKGENARPMLWAPVRSPGLILQCSTFATCSYRSKKKFKQCWFLSLHFCSFQREWGYFANSIRGVGSVCKGVSPGGRC